MNSVAHRHSFTSALLRFVTHLDLTGLDRQRQRESNTLLIERIDVPTAVAGSTPEAEDSAPPQTHDFGIMVG